MSIFKAAPVFGSGMVLQRDEPVKIWGEDGDGTEVTVSLGSNTTSCAPKNGHWECSFSPFKGGQSVSLSVRQGEKHFEYSDIVFGDVWIAGGQSNMEFFLRYEKHRKDADKATIDDRIRMYTCGRQCFSNQEIYQDDVGVWFKADDWRIEYFSAIGYYFASQITEKLNIPIGVISCNWGGTSASAWLPKNRLESKPLNIYIEDYRLAEASITKEECKQKSAEGWALQKDPMHKARWTKVMFGLSEKEQEEYMAKAKNNPVVPIGPYNKNRPGCLYENMVKPLLGLKVKGVLWYQGENDVHHAELYSNLFKELIASWREGFHAEIPFLFVQLAPFGKWMNLTGEMFPKIRRQQEIVSESVDSCFMTTTGDVGEETDIHPKEKCEIGRRLALMAEDTVYGLDVNGLPPKMQDVVINDSGFVVVFKNADDGIIVKGDKINDLAVICDDRRLKVKGFTTDKNKLIVRCRGIKHCKNIAILFAQSPYSNVNVFNNCDIPAVPFSFYKSAE